MAKECTGGGDEELGNKRQKTDSGFATSNNDSNFGQSNGWGDTGAVVEETKQQAFCDGWGA